MMSQSDDYYEYQEELENLEDAKPLSERVYTPRFKWDAKEIFNLFIYCGVLFLLIYFNENTIWSADYKMWIILFGVLGVWRYLWWFTHFIRALIYNQITFGKIRYQCSQLLNQGWRPNKVVFMVTAFNESEHVLQQMLSSLNREADLIARPCEVYLAIPKGEIEKKIEKVWAWIRHSKYIKLNIVRQTTPGKRAAIGAALRTISREGVDDNDPIVFMDGDTVLTHGCILKSIPIFVLEPTVHALTTNEKTKSRIAKWLENWFSLRFTQRNMIMQSHALSKRVLTLTGRMSIFRAGVILSEEFISTVEHDHLHHWLWGDFKFLSGDDKSTWYALLKMRADMLYVPDALVFTIEEVGESSLGRLKDNMLRWSGNILRNGWRAIKLGPGRIGFFIWWCLVDQRLIMFTMMAAPFIAISGTLMKDSIYLIVYIIWLMFSRLCLSFVLFYFHRRINMSFPFLLYANQLSTAIVKLYLLFRLPMQKWANRGDQELPVDSSSKSLNYARRAMSVYMTCLVVAIMGLIALIYIELLPPLNFTDVDVWLY